MLWGPSFYKDCLCTMSSSGNWLSYAERGGALRTRQTFLRSLQVSLCSQFTPLDYSPLFYASLCLAFFSFLR